MPHACLVKALKLLKMRGRSVFEVQEKLSSLGFPKKEIDDVIAALTSKNILNDRAFADAWIRYRLARPFGFIRIAAELEEKGITKNIIDHAVKAAKRDYVEDHVVMDQAIRKLALMGHVAPHRRLQRLHAFLCRRGFDAAIVLNVLQKIGKN